MLNFFLLLLAAIVAIPVILALVRIYRSRINLKFYERQGMKVYFNPTKGAFGLYDVKLPGNDKFSNMEYLKQLCKEYKHLPGIVTNQIQNNMSMVFLHDPEYVKEFLMHEEHFDKGSMERGWPEHDGFWGQNGEQAFKAKAIFSDLFNYDALQVFTPRLCEMIIASIQEFNKQKNVSSESFTTIDLDELFAIIFERVLNLFIFGRIQVEPTSTGKTYYQTVIDHFNLVPKVRVNPLFVLFPNIVGKFKLAKEYHQAYRYNEILKDFIGKWYKKREAEGDFGDCVFDRIILHNRRAKAEGRPGDFLNMQQVVGLVNIMQITGTDTSQNTSKMTICKMAAREDLKALISSINTEIFDEKGITISERLNGHPTLELWFKEALRLYLPAARVVPRIAKRDVVLKDLHIRKGDSLSVGYFGLMFNEDVFPDANTFKIDRFSKENEKAIPKYQYFPFFLGKRICMGKHLAELMVKLTVCQFIRMYDYKTPVNVEYYIKNTMISHLENPLVDVRLKPLIR